MCTAIAKKGTDVLYGYNLDIDPAVWSYKLIKKKEYFSVGITVGSKTYLTHGVNNKGQFGNLPYMNGEVFAVPKGVRRERIDLLNDKYIRGKYSFEDVGRIIREATVVNIPAATMHSLIGNRDGDFLVIEPGYGFRQCEDDFAVVCNFPILTELSDYSNPFYGKDRYDKALSVLQKSNEDFNVADALDLLKQVKQEGQWGTKISFVYSRNENAVYYCLDGNFDDIRIHRFS